MKIVIGSDHGGYELKEILVKYLKNKNIEIIDKGTYTTDSVDYPLIACEVSKLVAKGDMDKGILICGSGIGMSMCANKVHGIRASLCNDLYTAKYSRLHNNANVLCMGGRIIGSALAIEIVDVWLNTNYEGGRHDVRISKMTEIENIDK